MRKIPNTFGIDVTAARFLEYGSEDELRGLIAAGQVVAPWLHIGGGSNLLFIKDYEGTVLHSRIGGLEVTSEDEEHVWVRVGAGVVWDDFVAWCVKRHWYGAENLSLIPGEVGASAVQNIGAYVASFWRTGVLDPESNVQFGEGGAGAFSDGKLNTGTRDIRHRWILEQLAACGAPESILTDAKPHVGTDMLHLTLVNLRRQLLDLGAQVRFGHRVTGLRVRDGALEGLEVSSPETFL